ncbi:MAG: SirB2 family protein [Betaproteobacteria bacterium]|nr:SirB2 family protein [Betaproteobacteria bacterium]
MIEYYAQIKWAHIACATSTGSLFALRGLLMLAGSTLGMHAAVRYLSYTIDTALLTTALMLATMLHQVPFVQAWITVKIALVVVYIVLGSYALKRGATRRVRAGAFAAALATYGFIISIAVTHSPWGALSLLVQ